MLPPLTSNPPAFALRAGFRESNELGNPSHRLRFDLGCHRRQIPGSAILIDRGREEFAKDADRGGLE